MKRFLIMLVFSAYAQDGMVNSGTIDMQSPEAFYDSSIALANRECARLYGTEPFCRGNVFLYNNGSSYRLEGSVNVTEDSQYVIRIDFDSLRSPKRTGCDKICPKTMQLPGYGRRKGTYVADSLISKLKKRYKPSLPSGYRICFTRSQHPMMFIDSIVIYDNSAVMCCRRKRWIYSMESHRNIGPIIRQIENQLDSMKAGSYYRIMCDGMVEDVYTREKKYLCSNCCHMNPGVCKRFESVFDLAISLFGADSKLKIIIR